MAAATIIEVWGDFCWVPISSKSGVNHEQIRLNWHLQHIKIQITKF